MAKKSKETKVHVVTSEEGVMTGESIPHFSKVDKVHVTNYGIVGGGGEASSVDWSNVSNKPQTYPPSEHSHDDRYNTKEEVQGHIDYVTGLMTEGQGKVAAHADDTPDYLSTKIDNVTLAVEGSEVRVRNVEGLTVGVVDINEWLAGTSGNIQTQIDGISDSLSAITSGMNYLGRVETYADLTGVTNLENGNLVVVIADESRTGGRSMYVYSENLGAWEFIGEFIFTDEFTALKDTPTNYAGADGKVVKVAGERLVFSDVEYGDLSNKPESTITQIDDAVAKRHEHINGDLLDTYNQTNANITTAVVRAHTHDNKTEIDRLGVNEQGQLTIDGVAYVPASETTSKQYLHLRNGANQVISATGTKIRFNTKNYGDIPSDSTNSTFTLTGGKTYRITCSLAPEHNPANGNNSFGYELVSISGDNIGDVWGRTTSGGSTSPSSSGILDLIYSPPNDIECYIRSSEFYGSTTGATLRAGLGTLVIQEL